MHICAERHILVKVILRLQNEFKESGNVMDLPVEF